MGNVYIMSSLEKKAALKKKTNARGRRRMNNHRTPHRTDGKIKTINISIKSQVYQGKVIKTDISKSSASLLVDKTGYSAKLTQWHIDKTC